MWRGVGSQFCFLLARSLSSWSPITASWRPTARAVLSLILKESHTVFQIHHCGKKQKKSIKHDSVLNPPPKKNNPICLKLYYYYYCMMLVYLRFTSNGGPESTSPGPAWRDTTRLGCLVCSTILLSENQDCVKFSYYCM